MAAQHGRYRYGRHLAAPGASGQRHGRGMVVGTDTTRSFVLNTRPLFKLMVEKKASDLFFTLESPIKIKIEGKIMPVNRQVLTADQVRQAAYGLMNQEQIDYFQQELEIDFAISEPGLGPFPRRGVPPARQPRRGAALHHGRNAEGGGAGPAADRQRPGHDQARPRADGRRDRLGQIDVARVDDQLPQRELVGPHPHGRGPDRVPALRTRNRS